jgi:hypothetical protein
VDALSQNDGLYPGIASALNVAGIPLNESVTVPWQAGFDLAADPRWQLAQRIVASRSFARSALLSRFLLYVCEREITGKTVEVSEHQIGVQVFGRRADYNAGEDNIVRNYARQLRHRLDEYFLAEGSDETLQLSIPRGQYVPVYSARLFRPSPQLVVPDRVIENGVASLETVGPSTGSTVASTVGLTTLPSPANRRRHWQAFVLVSLALLTVLCIAWTHRVSAYAADSSHPLWAGLFSENRPTLIVPSDDGIVMIQNLTRHLVPLSEYINHDYLSLQGQQNIDSQNMKDLDAQRYTNVTDLNAVLRFSKLSEANGGQLVVRFAREVQMQDLKDANVILLGSSFSNPWAELFEKNLNFQFSYQPHPNASLIVNRHPQAGELPVYENDATGPSHRTYAVIGLTPNLNGSGWVLLVEGLTMAGTQAAVDTLFNRGAIRPLLAQIQDKDGTLNPFELLIETRSFGSDSPQANILATRVDKRHF